MRWVSPSSRSRTRVDLLRRGVIPRRRTPVVSGSRSGTRSPVPRGAARPLGHRWRREPSRWWCLPTASRCRRPRIRRSSTISRPAGSSSLLPTSPFPRLRCRARRRSPISPTRLTMCRSSSPSFRAHRCRRCSPVTWRPARPAWSGTPTAGRPPLRRPGTRVARIPGSGRPPCCRATRLRSGDLVRVGVPADVVRPGEQFWVLEEVHRDQVPIFCFREPHIQSLHR